MLLDGSEKTDRIIKRAINFDVMCGVARRAWARNENSIKTVLLHDDPRDSITLPYLCDDGIIDRIVK